MYLFFKHLFKRVHNVVPRQMNRLIFFFKLQRAVKMQFSRLIGHDLLFQ